jgi:hypothetical protein
MSWEEISRDEVPCPCGKGKVVITMRMDDWNRIETSRAILCDNCRAEADQRIQEQERIEKEKADFRSKAVSLAKERHLKDWLNGFNDLSKKKIWELIPKSPYGGYPSLGTFYKHVQHHGSVTAYLEWRFESDIELLFPSNIRDPEVEELLKKSK